MVNSMKNKKKKIKNIGKIGSGILADSVKISEHGKYDCYGVFTIIYAWGFPCSRSWESLITVFDLPKGDTIVDIALKKGNKVLKKMVSVTIDNQEPNGAATIHVPLRYRFDFSGIYNIECSIGDSPKRVRIPFELRTKEWPKFNKNEVNFAKGNPSIPQSLRANVHCDNCQYAYIFEETFIPDQEPSGGVYRFPESGKFECKQCDQIVELRDIQGQLRASLKDIISKKMQVER